MVRHALGKRICLASATRKHKTFNKVVTRAAFEEYDRIVLPKGQVAFWRKVETNIEVKDSGARTVLPGDVMIEVLTKTNYIFVIDFCLCITSSKCNDHPMDKGCIFLGNGVLKTPEDFGHIATRDETFRYRRVQRACFRPHHKMQSPRFRTVEHRQGVLPNGHT